MLPEWWRYGDLAPTGNRIALRTRAAEPEFCGYTSHWVQSGTAALALALQVARLRRPEIRVPRVILPAYGCPDLVAAAMFAGVQPVLVDIGEDDPGYDLDALAAALHLDVVAVVSVNFLGIADRLGALQSLLGGRGIALIEDNAQWFPEASQSSLSPDLHGDMVCLSFGRGKPVSLLGGGVLLLKDGAPPADIHIEPAVGSSAQWRLRVLLLNTVLHRRCYALLNRNPLISLGQTVYKPLAEVRGLDQQRRAYLGGAMKAYLALAREVENKWTEALRDLPGIRLIADVERCGRLLRYPLLCSDAARRDAIWKALDAAGLGVSAMYQKPLVEIAGVRDRVEFAGDYPNVARFASRLLTLPTHTGVTPADIKRARNLVARALNG